MKRAGIALVLLAGACTATPTPDRDNLAAALQRYSGMPVAPLALVHIGCQAISGESNVFACRWRQLEGRYWHGWQSRLSHAGESWQIVGEPSQRP